MKSFKIFLLWNPSKCRAYQTLFRGGHWGILETAKPKEKIIRNRKTAKKFGLIQVGNNRNDYFTYFLGVHVSLIEVSA